MTPSIAGYCRISVDEMADEENTSIENQKAIITDYAARQFPGSPLTFFEDRDRSGYTFAQREGYQSLRSALRAGQFQILILKDFSRFSRRNSLGLWELEQLRDEGIRIISIGDGIDYPTHDDWLNIQFRFLMNEMPVTDTSKKVRAVIKSRQSKGEWICSVPYGYYLDPLRKNEICIDKRGAEVVRLIYELYNEGWGYKRIANYLTEHGHPTGLQLLAEQIRARGGNAEKVDARASGVWNANTIAKIIGNDFYIGTLRQGKWERSGINKPDRRREGDGQFVFPGHHPAILEQAVFERAMEQAAHRTRSHYRGERKYAHPYSGLLYCADCGSPMFGISSPSRPAGYLCGSYHRRGLKGCTSHHTRESDLDDAVRGYIRTVRDGMQDALTALDEQRAKAHAAILSEQLRQLERQRAEIKDELAASARQRIRQIIARPEQEEIINETFDRLEQEYHASLAGLERRKELLSAEAEKRSELRQNISITLSIFDTLLNKAHFDRQDLQLILERVEVDRHGLVTIYLKGDITELNTLLQSTALEMLESNGTEAVTENKSRRI